MNSYAKRVFIEDEAKEVKLSEGVYDDEMVSSLPGKIRLMHNLMCLIKWSGIHTCNCVYSCRCQATCTGGLN